MSKVQLISYTPNPEKVVAVAAKLCYSTCNIDTLKENMDNESVNNFLNMLIELGHGSPWEHASFTFAIEDVSRSFLAQITRHRIASYSVQSQRYCNLDKTFSYITPDEISKNQNANEIFIDAMNEAYDNYKNLTSILKTEYIKSGMKHKDADKKAIENARAVLPNACETKLIVTMNARELINFFSLRCCSRAQDEIRNVAMEMLRQCKEVAPILFKYAGAPCLKGRCSEGKMTCGHPWKRVD